MTGNTDKGKKKTKSQETSACTTDSQNQGEKPKRKCCKKK